MSGSPDLRSASLVRIAAELTRCAILGICVFDREGLVLACEGVEAELAPPAGSLIHNFPWFAGLRDAIAGLPSSGGMLDLPGLGASALTAARVDVRIVWLEREGVFAALFLPADQRIAQDSAAAQTARENRILLEQVARQQEQIEAQNALLRTFVANVPAAVAMLDGDFNYVLASRRWREDFRSPGGELAGTPFRRGIAAGSRRFEQALRRKDGAIRAGVEKLTGADGEVDWHKWERQPWSHPGEVPGGTLVFSEKITRSVQQTGRLRAQTRRLAALNSQMRSFALAASHDLRAPLRQISAFARFLDEDHSADMTVEGREFIGLIRSCAGRMTAMIDALLRYARITYAEADASVFAVAEAVAGAKANLRHDILARGAVVEVAGDARVRGDFSLFAVLFQNLIDNALKYGKADAPKLVFCVTEDEAGVRIEATDDGPGIAPQVQGKAFDLFQRLGADAGVPGAGVGLATCRKIVELHGGDIEIDAAYAGGLRLAIQLPAQAVRATRRAKSVL